MLMARMEEVAHHRSQPVGKGFYVDVGAFKPVSFSNTYGLYRRGWRGITIEPSPGSAPMFRAVRPRDVFVNTAAGNRNGSIRFYTWGTPTVVNTADPHHAAEFERRLSKTPDIVDVPVRTLADILAEHARTERVDILSIDVEGLTLDVLNGNDWSVWRPTWIIIEVDRRPVPGQELDTAISYLHAYGYSIVGFTGPSVLMERL